MRTNGRLLLKNPFLTAFYLLFIVVYILQVVLPAPDPAILTKYGLSILNAKLLGLSVELPYIIIWIIALLGYLRLKTYAALIQQHKDGAAFKTLSHGLLYLTLWLPLSAVVGNLVVQTYRYHPASTVGLVRLNVYFNLIILILGFAFVYKGSSKLLRIVSGQRFQALLPAILGYIVFSALYTFLTLHDPARARPAGSVSVASYYESDWVIVTTTVIPRLIAWFLGVQAVYNIYLYGKEIKGTLYRAALKNLALGLGGVIATTMVLRCLQSLTSVLEQLNLNFLLVLIYVLLLVMSAGYVLIAKGTYNLQKLEET